MRVYVIIWGGCAPLWGDGWGVRMWTVFIVEDDAEHRSRFEAIVSAAREFELAGSVGTASEALAWLNTNCADVLLCDLGLPDGDGRDVIRRARERCPNLDAMVVTVFGDEPHVVSSIEAGATGYILKDAMPEQFEQTMLELKQGGSPISPSIARHLLKRFQIAAPAPAAPAAADRELLSTREREILQAIAKGLSYADIAAVHTISLHTVTSHIKNIYRKLEVHSRGEAVFEASQRGIL